MPFVVTFQNFNSWPQSRIIPDATPFNDGVMTKEQAAKLDSLTPSAGGYDTVENEGTPLAQQRTLNFDGLSIVASDDPGNSRTDVALPAAVDVVFGADGTPGAVMIIAASLGANVPTGDYDVTYQGPKIQLYLINLLKNGVAGSAGNNVTVKNGASSITTTSVIIGPNPNQFRTAGFINLSQVLNPGDTLRLSVVNDGTAADTGCTIFMNGVLR